VTRLVLIDFDGTLCSTREAIVHCMQRTFASFGRLVPSRAEIEQIVSEGIGLVESLYALDPTLGILGTSELDEWIARYRSLYDGVPGDERTFAYDGAVRLLEALARRDITAVVVTNKAPTAVRRALRRLGLDRHLAGVVATAPGVRGKPHRDLFDRFIAPSFPAVDELLVFGDTLADLCFARNIGARCCWAAYGYGDARVCRAIAPDWIAEEPMALLSAL
jgi:phosphoglycolate phosphatase